MPKLIIDAKRFGMGNIQEIEFSNMAEALDIFNKERDFSIEYVLDENWKQTTSNNYWLGYLDEENYVRLEVRE